jgi:phage shock protein C
MGHHEVKKLYRSRKNRVIAGVMGGLGEYLDIDPTILRLLYIFVVILTAVFPGLIAYILAALIVPVKS